MTGQQVAQVFGPNMPSRIAGTSQVILEPGEVAPTLPWYQPVVPFYPPSISSGGGANQGCTSLTADGHLLWQQTPSRCDLLFYQGDDVIIPLYFNDKSLLGDDMSDQKWIAQIRIVHRYTSKLIAEFVTAATYNPGDGDEETEHTMVEMFLPRAANKTFGQFRWDLYSVDSADLTRFPMPVNLPEDEVWPPPDALRTWLYGQCTIAPRVTSTDVLYGSAELPLVPWPGPPPDVTVLTTGGWTVGPNGRVP